MMVILGRRNFFAFCKSTEKVDSKDAEVAISCRMPRLSCWVARDKLLRPREAGIAQHQSLLEDLLISYRMTGTTVHRNCCLGIPACGFAGLVQRHLYFLFALQLFCGLGARIFHAQTHFPTQPASPLEEARLSYADEN
jgi:hypothetical protein